MFFALFECFLAGSNQGDRTRAGRLLQPHAADRREQPETRHSLPLKEQKVPDTASLSSAGLGLCITMDTITLCCYSARKSCITNTEMCNSASRKYCQCLMLQAWHMFLLFSLPSIRFDGVQPFSNLLRNV